MSPIQKYCTVCKCGGHYTKDCWGPGTVVWSGPPQEPIFWPANVPIPNQPKTKLLRAIEPVKEIEQ